MNFDQQTFENFQNIIIYLGLPTDRLIFMVVKRHTNQTILWSMP